LDVLELWGKGREFDGDWRVATMNHFIFAELMALTAAVVLRWH